MDDPGAKVEKSLLFRITRVDDAPIVSLLVDGGPTVQAPLDVSWRDGRTSMRALALIEKDDCERADLAFVGTQLWESIKVGDVGTRIDEAQKDASARLILRFDVSSDLDGLDRLPWEAVYDRQRHFLACHPSYCVVRHPPPKLELQAANPRPRGALRILIVVPEGSHLSVDHEVRNIATVFQTLTGTVDSGAPFILSGSVTPDRLRKQLTQMAPDIVHFIGHGRLDEAGETSSIRLNDENGDDHWMDADTFGELFQEYAPKLVFLNCCDFGTPPDSKSVRGFSGAGPSLLAAGVPAIVAMRYEIADAVAIQFASAFYQELLAGADAGRIDIAVSKARKTVLLNHTRGKARGFATPLLFLAPRHERLFVGESPRAPATVSSEPMSGGPEIDVPADLVLAVREGRCIPVLGPALLGAVRSTSSALPVNLRALTEALAKQSNYPESRELLIAENSGDWLEGIVLQRVCQHFERRFKRRAPLTAAIRDAYRSVREVPPIFRAIAKWKTPGAVCTYFDGLVQVAFQEARGGGFCAVHDVGQAVGEDEVDLPLIIHLRGSILAPDSLVLTEQDHDVLWDKLNRLAPRIGSLVTGDLDRYLLLLGVSPRDPWLRRFLRQIRPESAKNAGPIFIASPDRSPVDEAYWERFGVEWLSVSADALVEAISLRIVAPEGM